MFPGHCSISIYKKHLGKININCMCSERLCMVWWRKLLLNRKWSYFNSTTFTHNQKAAQGFPLTNLNHVQTIKHRHEGLRFHLSQGCNVTNWALSYTHFLLLSKHQRVSWLELFISRLMPHRDLVTSVCVCVCESERASAPPPSVNRALLFIWIKPKKAETTDVLKFMNLTAHKQNPGVVLLRTHKH